MFRKVFSALLAIAAFFVLNQSTDVFAGGVAKFRALRSAPLYGPVHEVNAVNYSDTDLVVTIYFIGPSVVSDPDVETLAPGGVYHQTVLPIEEVRHAIVTWEGGPDDIGATWCAFRSLEDWPSPGNSLVCTEMK